MISNQSLKMKFLQSAPHRAHTENTQPIPNGSNSSRLIHMGFFTVAVAIAVFGVFFSPSKTAHAAAYEGQVVAQSSDLVFIEDNRMKQVWVDIKNTGTEAWPAGSPVITTADPLKRQSVFRASSWGPWSNIASRVFQTVNPGETVRFYIDLAAPFDDEDSYREVFQARLLGSNLIQGTEFSFFPHTVRRYEGQVVDITNPAVTLQPNEKQWFSVWVRNDGTRTWKKDGSGRVVVQTYKPYGRTSILEDSSWLPNAIPTVLDEPAIVPPGGVGRFSFLLQAPNYEVPVRTEYFKLVSQGQQAIRNSYFSMDVTVRQEKPQATLKVGIFHNTINNKIEVTGNGAFTARAGHERSFLASFSADQVATIRMENGKYRLTGPGVNLLSNKYIRFVPSGETILKFNNFLCSNHPNTACSWDNSDDNRFRGNLIAQESSITGEFWAINELPMELYLRGVAEQSNGTHATHLKTMSVIERTYAQYIYESGGKHPENNHHLNNTSGDQVYKGYNFELRSPNVTTAVDATRGQMVTKNGNIVVTPYFSRADGRTRSWEEVWNGSYDHLVSVPDPWTDGLSLLGHGVGLSAYGALSQAQEGRLYTNILKYYYTGVLIKDYY